MVLFNQSQSSIVLGGAVDDELDFRLVGLSLGDFLERSLVAEEVLELLIGLLEGVDIELFVLDYIDR